MYKNQLQELAQRSCFNLPSYACVREGPDHAPRFKASVNFNGEIFQGPSHCTTLRQAEHAAAEIALANLSSRAPSRSLAARVLDETGVYKNLLQETTHRAGLKLPVYTTVRSGPGHQPVFTSTVELAGMCIAGEPAKTKKQAEKNAAMAAWSSLKQMPDLESLSEGNGGEEQEQVVRYLHNLKPKEENKQSRQKKKFVAFNEGNLRTASPHRSLRLQQQWSLSHQQQQQKNCAFLAPAVSTGPKVMPPLLFALNSSVSKEAFSVFSRPMSPVVGSSSSSRPISQAERSSSSSVRSHFFADSSTSVLAARAFNIPMSNSSTIPVPRMMNTGGLFHTHGIAPAVQIRSVIPVCAAPPRQPQQQPVAIGLPASTPNKETEDISAAISKLHKLQL